ncbi:MAG TPA: TraR/DksA family transcriptional regulator [Paracoccaceae bacterium]|nr:TraR/DksA family transcriptional regulator [Paracoccaceae bacterium]HMO71906.1 TraR/DksA family transcriptional regulator [Paracoccaceae bacterium]
MTDLATRRAALVARLRELDRRLVRIEDRLDDTPDPDWEERATEREEDEVLEGLGLAAQAEVRRIRAALDRIAAGDYGLCARCGQDIPPARLDAIPSTPLCRNCAEATEEAHG